ncbi:hypothetical protein NQ315_005757 [Exocentrus adspersus]|uniref:Uncharacterized protein n=1 Tax=Exocentrus adspersus TaxID=1586481 RepID=A0AAV8VBZ3_9CUCU|nr:hypothetical protein NQ315_005757 [Exocentrus adspersus]
MALLAKARYYITGGVPKVSRETSVGDVGEFGDRVPFHHSCRGVFPNNVFPVKSYSTTNKL